MSNRGKNPPTGDYTIGYCKPPKQHQWQKGQSGNPKGRRKLPSDIAECTVKALEQTIKVFQGARMRRITVGDAIAQRQVQKAAMGDRLAVREVMRAQQEYFARGQTENGWVIVDARPAFDGEEQVHNRIREENRQLREENERLKASFSSLPQLPSPVQGQEQP